MSPLGTVDRRTAPGTIEEAIQAFCFAGPFVDTQRLSHGHIHQSFLVTCTGGRYVLQRLNDRVFPDVAVVVANTQRVLSHLEAGGRPVPQLVESEAGAHSCRTRDGSTWRAFTYLEGTVERIKPRGPSDAFEAARAFADYQVALNDLPAPALADTIFRFHHLPTRLASLETMAVADPLLRRAAVNDEIERARLLALRVEAALGVTAERGPPRLVHNDAKLSNVLFDQSGRAVCVIDYDTTMVGAVRHDVGELVRSVSTHAAEDCTDEDEVDFDLEMVEAVARRIPEQVRGARGV